MTLAPSPLTFAAALQDTIRRVPDKVALRDATGRELTFAAYGARAERLNDAVFRLGVNKGARVAVLSRNRIDYAEVFALAKSGLIVVPLNWRLTEEEILQLLRHCAPELIFVDAEHAAIIAGLRGSLASVKAIIGFEASSHGFLGYEDLLSEAAPPREAVTVLPQDPICVIYTSGTTGAPKGVTLSHEGAIGNARLSANAMLGLRPDDRVLAVMPFFHVGGLWYHFFPALLAGCTTTILPEFNPATVIETLQADRITVVHLVPSMVNALLQRPEIGEADLSALRLVFYAASPMPSALLRRAMDAFPNSGFLQSFGSTEAGIVSTLSVDDHRHARQPGNDRLLLSCGRPLQGCDVRIRMAEAPCRPGEIGELEIRSPYTMAGYWSDAPATDRVRPDGWLRTGDLGYADEAGYLYLVDRKNDMIVTGGENVYPTEVEEQLLRIPGIAEAVVFGVPDSRWIEKVVAAVVCTPEGGPPADDIIATLRRHLAHYKCPKQIFFVDELPKSGVGKVLRKRVRDTFREQAP